MKVSWVGRRLVGLLLAGFIVLGSGSAEADVGIDEKLGDTVSLDLEFLDENGDPVTLGDLMDGPTVLSLVYFKCPGICGPLMGGLADVIEKIDLVAGTDYRVLTISFDPTETPDLARRKKANYFKVVRRPLGEDGWRFLTGKAEAIDALTDAVGFRYERTGKDFQHPGAIILLSPEGKVTRYLYGVEFLPFDVKMAVFEASEGRVGPTVSKMLLYCFSYDPEGQTYVFNILKVTGTVTILFVIAFVVFLVITTRRYRRRQGEGG